MKKLSNILLVSSCIFLLSQASLGQITEGFHYGVRLGIGESYTHINNIDGLNSKLLLSGGMTANYQFNRFLGVSADFLVTGKGGQRNGFTSESATSENRAYSFTDTYRLNYVEVPLMLKLSIPVGGEFSIRAFTGPSLNFFFSGWENRVYDNKDYNENYGFYNREITTMNTADGGWVLGAGVDINTQNGHTYILDLRSSIGSSPAGRLYNNYARNTYYMLSVGYLIN